MNRNEGRSLEGKKRHPREENASAARRVEGDEEEDGMEAEPEPVHGDDFDDFDR